MGDPDAPFTRQLEFESYRDRTPPSLHGKSTEEENQMYLDRIHSLPPDNQSRTLFVAFKPMRSLNKGDVLPRKEDVDAARNLFREILIRKLHDNLIFRKNLEFQFIGFNTMEFHLKPAGPGTDENPYGEKIDFEQLTAGLVRDANLEFRDAMERLVAKERHEMNRFLTTPGIVSDLSAWHPSAMSTGHPDLASFEARGFEFNPQMSTKLVTPRFDAPKSHQLVVDVENTRRALQAKHKYSPFMKLYEEGRFVLSETSLELVRKYREMPVEEARKAFRAQATLRFGAAQTDKLSDLDIDRMFKYYNQADRFSPPVRTAKPVVLDPDEATDGWISVDFAGQGIVNQFHTMGAVAHAANSEEPSKPTRGVEAVLTSREYDAKATARLDKLRAEFQGALDRAGIKAKAEFTGDDGGVRLPPGTPATAYRRLLEELAKLPGGSEKRVVYSPAGSAKRSAKHTRMEFLEKDLRHDLRGKIPEDQLFRMAFDSQIDPQTGQCQVFIVGPHTDKSVEQIKALLRTPAYQSLNVGSVQAIGLTLAP
jgi:hypothetical protein